MSKTIIRYANSQNVEFIKALRTNVNDYFIKNNISKYANTAMKVKTAFMLLLYSLPLVAMISGLVQTTWLMYLMWFVMALGMSGIGLAVMHDANHGAYSKNKNVNNFFGWVLNLVGGYHVNWKIQHNVLHHSFTNVDGHDEDIKKPVMRFSPNQENKKVFKYQAYYAPLFYGLLTIYWLLAKDIVQVINYHKRNLLKTQKKSLGQAIAEIVLYKVGYVLITLVLPIVVLNVPTVHVVLGFLMMHFISGLILALIFQCAHVLEETEFFTDENNGSMENNWAIHQLKTTANFATKSKLTTWVMGGLNHQIEHHLFPHICHIHYSSISKIVERTAKDFNIPYHKHPTFYHALKSHFTFLNALGRGTEADLIAKTA
jgi:linoleoyl-CoA desaturase